MPLCLNWISDYCSCLIRVINHWTLTKTSPILETTCSKYCDGNTLSSWNLFLRKCVLTGKKSHWKKCRKISGDPVNHDFVVVTVLFTTQQLDLKQHWITRRGEKKKKKKREKMTFAVLLGMRCKFVGVGCSECRDVRGCSPLFRAKGWQTHPHSGKGQQHWRIQLSSTGRANNPYHFLCGVLDFTSPVKPYLQLSLYFGL